MMGPSNPNAPRPPIDPYDGWDLTNRPAMLPFLAEYTNRQTGEKSGGFAWPTMVTEPLRAANELLNTPPGTMPNPQNPEQQENALTLLMSLYGGNALGRLASAPRNALADTALARYPAVMEERLFRQQPSLGPDTGKPSIMGSAIAGTEAKPQGFIAYHGSPHDFDKFDMSKIGTGEGAQAYGHGLYFAESPKVARAYEGMLTGNGYDPAVIARDALVESGGNATKALADLEKATPPKIGLPELDILTNNYDIAKQHMQAHIAGTPLPLPHKGRMYQVRINANPEDFIDWDKPLSQQPQAASALSRIQDAIRHDMDIEDRNPDFPGLRTILAEMGPEATNALQDAGIPGIRYLDQGSRSAGEGSRNFVVFDDNIIDILKKYGIVPGMAAGANALSNYDPSITY